MTALRGLRTKFGVGDAADADAAADADTLAPLRAFSLSCSESRRLCPGAGTNATGVGAGEIPDAEDDPDGDAEMERRGPSYRPIDSSTISSSPEVRPGDSTRGCGTVTERRY